MMKLARVLCILSLFLGCRAEADATRVVPDADLLKPLAQRVTATVKRETTRLLRVETEHETFVTTPEHPFASPQSGWIAAGQLVPGDPVVSAKFGVVSVLSVQTQTPAQPVAVFNLTVDRSHAYLVGKDQVLVHNTGCKDGTAGPQEDTLTQRTRELEETERKIEALKADPITPESQKRLAELTEQRKKLKQYISNTMQRRRRKLGLPANQRLLEQAEADYESATKALEEAQSTLQELEDQQPESPAEQAALAARKAELKKSIQKLELDSQSAKQILSWETQLAKLDGASPTTDDQRAELEREKAKLKASIAEEKSRRRVREYDRKRHADPEQRAQINTSLNQKRRRKLRTADYVADSTRPPDTLELLQAKLAAARQEPASATRDQRLADLTDRVTTLTALVELRRGLTLDGVGLYRARLRREGMITRGEDTSALDLEIAHAKHLRDGRRAEIAKLRARALLLGIEGMRRQKASHGIDDGLLRELESEVAEGGLIDQERLRRIEREFAETLHGTSDDTLDAEFFEEIWREYAE